MNDLYDETVRSVNTQGVKTLSQDERREKGPASSEINRLNGLVDELTSAVQSMQRKLEPILGPEFDEASSDPEVNVKASAVTDALRTINSRVIDATAWLNRINSRVEL